MESGITFKTYTDVSKAKDTILYHSGTTIAMLEDYRYMLTLEVRGLVRVVYKGQVYKNWEQFPKELLEMFEQGTADDNEDVEIGHNSWFEIIAHSVYNNPKGAKVYTSIEGFVFEDLLISTDKLLKDMDFYLKYLHKGGF